MNEYQLMQDTWQNVNNLAALAATPGIDEDTKQEVNVLIRSLLKNLNPLFQKLSANASGIVTA